MSDIMSYLFKTNAIRFCEENKPFWYTSGKIGPYFINAHFVFGSEKEASEFLSFIDECLADQVSLPKKVFSKAFNQYQNNEIYRFVINTIKQYIEQNIDVSEIAIAFGGGGHPRAAGYTMKDEVEIEKEKLIKAVGEMI